MNTTIRDRVASLMARAALVVVLTVILVMVVGPFVDIGSSVYLMWHRGYGTACDSRTLSEALSPSQQWVARARLVSCGGVAGGQSAEVVLVPNVLIPLAVRYTNVFFRDIESGMRQHGDHLTVHWVDDHSLELQGVPCPPCQIKDHHESCDLECKVLSDVSGITVSITSVEN
jgi:hypothetical protein